MDHWHDNYEGAPTDGSAWLSEDKSLNRRAAGGSWFDIPRNCRSAVRDNATPDYRNFSIGFRVLCCAQTDKYRRADELLTAKGIDYTKLRDLLATEKWREADEETWKVMVQVAKQEKRGYLYVDDIGKIPSIDLQTIDQLWVKYSNGRFGFSVQKRIWYEVNQDWQKFITRVGWRVLHTAFTFSLDAPVGHLPYQFGTSDSCWVWGSLGVGARMDYLLSRQDIQI